MIDARKYSPAVYDRPNDLKQGSAEYHEWWQTHIKRCFDGYKPHGGSRITGPHYFYINFCQIDFFYEDEKGNKRKKVEHPLYRDMDNEYFTEVEEAEKGGYGLIVLKARRKGFEQPHSEIVKGEFGDVAMGDLKIGDKVWTHKGTLSSVVDKFPQGEKDVYEVCLMDGRKVRCGIDHLWEVHSYYKKKWHKKIIDTRDLIESGLHYNTGQGYKAHKFYIAPIKEIEYGRKDLPIDPYLLGCLIGDGNIKGENKTPAISSADKEILDEIQRILGSAYELNRDGLYKYRIVYKDRDKHRHEGDNRKYGFNPLKRAIKKLELNIGSHDKFIPDIYKYSSVDQRMELVRGLMDTDGTINSDGMGIMYASQSGRLIKDVLEVLRSLGIKCSAGAPQSCGTKRVNIRTNKPIFKLSRKLDRLKNSNIRRWEYTAITDIKKLDYKEESSCILIDDVDHVYLTTDFVPTHNSFMNSGLLLHEWTFYPDSSVGIGAQTDKFVQDFRDKVLITYNRLPDELRNRWVVNNKDLLKGGYKTKSKGVEITKGTGSKIHFRVADKPDVFRGLSLKKMVFEEAGEFLKLEETFLANLECFREGDIQYGLPIIGGTSNMLSHESPDFIRMYNKPERYNLKPLFFSANRGYGIVHPFFDSKTGTSNIEESTKAIMARREKEKSSGDKKSYYSFLQEMPLVPEDAFLMLGSSPFDIEKIDSQLAKIAQNKYLKIVRKGRLEWPANREGKSVFGSKPIFIDDKNGWLEVIDGGHPISGYKNAHVAGVDPYHVSDDLDEKGSGKKLVDKSDRSKGSMCVFRKYISPHEVGDLPVAFYTDRPYSKEDFYENCAKIAIYYDTQILVENNDDGFLQYFIKNQLIRYLKERPRSADSPFTQAVNRFGIHMKEFQKKLVTELLDEYIKRSWEEIYFVDLLEELKKFGNKNTDMAMAFGIALLHDMDNTRRVKAEDEEEEVERMPAFRKDASGRLISVHTQNNKNFKQVGKKVTFDFESLNPGKLPDH